MTNEEAISFLQGRIDLIDKYYPQIEDYREALDMAIKALEQEPVLDKIRAEIEEEYGYCNICEYFEDYDYEDNDISEYRYVASVKDILQIINKYKAESEE